MSFKSHKDKYKRLILIFQLIFFITLSILVLSNTFSFANVLIDSMSNSLRIILITTMSSILIGSLLTILFFSSLISSIEHTINAKRHDIHFNICIDALMERNFFKAEYLYYNVLKRPSDKKYVKGLMDGIKYGVISPVYNKNKVHEHWDILEQKYVL